MFFLFVMTFLLGSVSVLMYIYAPDWYAFIQKGGQCGQASRFILFRFFNQCVHSLRTKPVTLVLFGLLDQLN